MQTTDVMIHLNDAPSHAQQQEIEASLREMAGVIAPRFNKRTLLVVLYDPGQIDSGILLKKVTGQGFTAQLVGL
jgi:hypothetical protein